VDIKLKYRKASVRDVGNLVGLRCEFLREIGCFDEKDRKVLENANKEYFLKSLENGSFVSWLAIADGEIMATSGICFYTVPPNAKSLNGKVGYIQNMYTKKDFRRKGIAKALLEKTIEEARSRGCDKVILGATETGRGLYEKFGFTEMEDEMEYWL
jgi:ribosomal protein S18 acetylase RimI-like enzyme